MKREFQVRFRERLGLKCPCLLDLEPAFSFQAYSSYHAEHINELKKAAPQLRLDISLF